MLRQTVETMIAFILVPGIANVLVPRLILARTGGRRRSRLGAVDVAAAGLIGLGVAAMAWVAATFVRRGKGTPIPLDPPKEFIAGGLYRYVRNPMYVGALAVLAGEALLYRSWRIALYGTGLWAALHSFAVLIEEPQLERRFGETYRRYKTQTPRWAPAWDGGASRGGSGHDSE